MKILIADDEAPARMRLRAMLESMDDCSVVAEAANGEQVLQRCVQLHPEVVLLDIRMPGMDGIEAARHLLQLPGPPAVIFTTAYDQHALEAFEANAVDYLLKPVREQRLRQALDKARRLSEAQMSALTLEAQPPRARSRICSTSRGNMQLIPVSEILYFLADQKYVTVRHPGGEVLIEESLKSLEQEFGARFVRIHRNALVARRALIGVEKSGSGTMVACLQGLDERLEISRRHLPEVRRILKEGV